MNRRLFGDNFINSVSQFIHRSFGAGYIPVWNPFVPRPAPLLPYSPPLVKNLKKIVYFPTCVNRVFGTYPTNPTDKPSVSQIIVTLLERTGHKVLYSFNLFSKTCCGLAFASKGFPKQAERKAAELEKVLLEISEGGQIPILCDASPCFLQMKTTLSSIQTKKLKVIEPIQLAQEYLLPNLQIEPIQETVCIHTPCSSKKMGLESAFKAVVQKCATNVIESQVPCCGMAGDRGLLFPELPNSSLKSLKGLMQSQSKD